MLHLVLALAAAVPPADATHVRGITVSCQTWGREWATDEFARDLDALRALGVNWVAIHPYVSIAKDGALRWRTLDADAPPAWIARPIREAHARGMSILVVPHVAYWGSPWRCRAEIELDDAGRARFFADHERFLVELASCARGADAFAIGNELDRLVTDEAPWRRAIAAVRARTSAKLTYAASWSTYEDVPFWDALDAIGIDAYFPLAESEDPSEAELRASWARILGKVEAVSLRLGKPVVFTELGYNVSLAAAREPWAYAQARGEERARAEELQTRLLRVALDEVDARRSWLRGAFLWKWFVGPADRENFLLTTPPVRATIGAAWGGR